MTGEHVSNSEIWEALGSLRASHDAMRNEFRRSDTSARESRERTYLRLEEHGQRLTSIEEDVAEMKPAVRAFTDLRTKASGAVLVLGVIGAIFGLLIGAFTAELKGWLFWLFGAH